MGDGMNQVHLKAKCRQLTIRAASAIYCIFVMCGTPVAGAPVKNSVVAVSSDTQQRLGISTVSLSSVEQKTQIAAFAKVLDPGPLALLYSDLFVADAASSASGAEARRSAALHAADSNMSAKDMEAAGAQAKSDEAKRKLLRQRLGLEWGSGISRLSDPKLKELVQALASGSAALVHVDTPSNGGQKDARTVDIDIGTDSVKGTVLGPARVAEPRLSSSGLLVEVRGPLARLLSVGLTLGAHIDTSTPVKGVLLPREALVRFRGSTWAYVKQSPDHFQRRLVQDGIPEDNGLFVPQGFTANELVVSDGSAQLFAVEQSQTTMQPAN
jgi:hypothetical protein